MLVITLKRGSRLRLNDGPRWDQSCGIKPEFVKAKSREFPRSYDSEKKDGLIPLIKLSQISMGNPKLTPPLDVRLR